MSHFVGLDVPLQIELADLLNALRHNNNLTLILITHNVVLARILCDRIALLKEGKCQEILSIKNFDTGNFHSEYSKSMAHQHQISLGSVRDLLEV